MPRPETSLTQSLQNWPLSSNQGLFSRRPHVFRGVDGLDAKIAVLAARLSKPNNRKQSEEEKQKEEIEIKQALKEVLKGIYYISSFHGSKLVTLFGDYTNSFNALCRPLDELARYYGVSSPIVPGFVIKTALLPKLIGYAPLYESVDGEASKEQNNKGIVGSEKMFDDLKRFYLCDTHIYGIPMGQKLAALAREQQPSSKENLDIVIKEAFVYLANKLKKEELKQEEKQTVKDFILNLFQIGLPHTVLMSVCRTKLFESNYRFFDGLEILGGELASNINLAMDNKGNVYYHSYFQIIPSNDPGNTKVVDLIWHVIAELPTAQESGEDRYKIAREKTYLEDKSPITTFLFPSKSLEASMLRSNELVDAYYLAIFGDASAYKVIQKSSIYKQWTLQQRRIFWWACMQNNHANQSLKVSEIPIDSFITLDKNAEIKPDLACAVLMSILSYNYKLESFRRLTLEKYKSEIKGIIKKCDISSATVPQLLILLFYADIADLDGQSIAKQVERKITSFYKGETFISDEEFDDILYFKAIFASTISDKHPELRERLDSVLAPKIPGLAQIELGRELPVVERLRKLLLGNMDDKLPRDINKVERYLLFEALKQHAALIDAKFSGANPKILKKIVDEIINAMGLSEQKGKCKFDNNIRKLGIECPGFTLKDIKETSEFLANNSEGKKVNCEQYYEYMCFLQASNTVAELPNEPNFNLLLGRVEKEPDKSFFVDFLQELIAFSEACKKADEIEQRLFSWAGGREIALGRLLAHLPSFDPAQFIKNKLYCLMGRGLEKEEGNAGKDLVVFLGSDVNLEILRKLLKVDDYTRDVETRLPKIKTKILTGIQQITDLIKKGGYVALSQQHAIELEKLFLEISTEIEQIDAGIKVVNELLSIVSSATPGSPLIAELSEKKNSLETLRGKLDTYGKAWKSKLFEQLINVQIRQETANMQASLPDISKATKFQSNIDRYLTAIETQPSSEALKELIEKLVHKFRDQVVPISTVLSRIGSTRYISLLDSTDRILSGYYELTPILCEKLHSIGNFSAQDEQKVWEHVDECIKTVRGIWVSLGLLASCEPGEQKRGEIIRKQNRLERKVSILECNVKLRELNANIEAVIKNSIKEGSISKEAICDLGKYSRELDGLSYKIKWLKFANEEELSGPLLTSLALLEQKAIHGLVNIKFKANAILARANVWKDVIKLADDSCPETEFDSCLETKLSKKLVEAKQKFFENPNDENYLKSFEELLENPTSENLLMFSKIAENESLYRAYLDLYSRKPGGVEVGNNLIFKKLGIDNLTILPTKKARETAAQYFKHLANIKNLDIKKVILHKGLSFVDGLDDRRINEFNSFVEKPRSPEEIGSGLHELLNNPPGRVSVSGDKKQSELHSKLPPLFQLLFEGITLKPRGFKDNIFVGQAKNKVEITQQNKKQRVASLRRIVSNRDLYNTFRDVDALRYEDLSWWGKIWNFSKMLKKLPDKLVIISEAYSAYDIGLGMLSGKHQEVNIKAHTEKLNTLIGELKKNFCNVGNTSSLIAAMGEIKKQLEEEKPVTQLVDPAPAESQGVKEVALGVSQSHICSSLSGTPAVAGATAVADVGTGTPILPGPISSIPPKEESIYGKLGLQWGRM